MSQRSAVCATDMAEEDDADAAGEADEAAIELRHVAMEEGRDPAAAEEAIMISSHSTDSSSSSPCSPRVVSSCSGQHD